MGSSIATMSTSTETTESLVLNTQPSASNAVASPEAPEEAPPATDNSEGNSFSTISATEEEITPEAEIKSCTILLDRKKVDDYIRGKGATFEEFLSTSTQRMSVTKILLEAQTIKQLLQGPLLCDSLAQTNNSDSSLYLEDYVTRLRDRSAMIVQAKPVESILPKGPHMKCMFCRKLVSFSKRGLSMHKVLCSRRPKSKIIEAKKKLDKLRKLLPAPPKFKMIQPKIQEFALPKEYLPLENFVPADEPEGEIYDEQLTQMYHQPETVTEESQHPIELVHSMVKIEVLDDDEEYTEFAVADTPWLLQQESETQTDAKGWFHPRNGSATVFFCAPCKKEFGTTSALKDHILQVHREVLACTMVTVGPKKKGLKMAKFVSGVSPFLQCPACKALKETANLLVVHMQYHHPNFILPNEAFRCSKVPVKLMKTTLLHTLASEQYTCGYCTIKYNRFLFLKQHLTSHGVYECENCISFFHTSTTMHQFCPKCIQQPIKQDPAPKSLFDIDVDCLKEYMKVDESCLGTNDLFAYHEGMPTLTPIDAPSTFASSSCRIEELNKKNCPEFEEVFLQARENNVPEGVAIKTEVEEESEEAELTAECDAAPQRDNWRSDPFEFAPAVKRETSSSDYDETESVQENDIVDSVEVECELDVTNNESHGPNISTNEVPVSNQKLNQSVPLNVGVVNLETAVSSDPEDEYGVKALENLLQKLKPAVPIEEEVSEVPDSNWVIQLPGKSESHKKPPSDIEHVPSKIIIEDEKQNFPMEEFAFVSKTVLISDTEILEGFSKLPAKRQRSKTPPLIIEPAPSKMVVMVKKQKVPKKEFDFVSKKILMSDAILEGLSKDKLNLASHANASHSHLLSSKFQGSKPRIASCLFCTTVETSDVVIMHHHLRWGHSFCPECRVSVGNIEMHSSNHASLKYLQCRFPTCKQTFHVTEQRLNHEEFIHNYHAAGEDIHFIHPFYYTQQLDYSQAEAEALVNCFYCLEFFTDQLLMEQHLVYEHNVIVCVDCFSYHLNGTKCPQCQKCQD